MPHIKGHHRELFLDMLGTVFNTSTGRNRQSNWRNYRNEDGRTADDLCGLLWNCTDICPADSCADADMPRGSTYAQVARTLRKWAASR